MNTIALPLLMLFAISIQTGAALRCWVCSSPVGGVCGDPFNSSILSHTTECAPPRRHHGSSGANLFQPDIISHVCKKVIQREHGALMVVRSCGYERFPNEACGGQEESRRITARHHRDDVRFCQVCREDGCNAAASTYNLLVALLASAGAAILVFFS
ncbi:uncharacterized protein LOC132194133 [Neocloeon triangulifer]|uniref:uncharacterized protein LOC132194133 n=1 Tax=Neocloeon triangulifer TaxID=2078957 RepID=UPI00286ED4D7|nr:uncharacterized protein LOC132194133 [Neocloeon triangulifer]